MRGNQTNNFVKSQFLVLKDIILGRVKEYNLVALLDRLTIDLENYFKGKLLSVADGGFDGHCRRRFMGKKKHKGDGGQGFKVPSEDIQKKFLETVQQFPNGIFQICSVSQDNKWYVLLFKRLYSGVVKLFGKPLSGLTVIWRRSPDQGSQNCLPGFTVPTCYYM